MSCMCGDTRCSSCGPAQGYCVLPCRKCDTDNETWCIEDQFNCPKCGRFGRGYPNKKEFQQEFEQMGKDLGWSEQKMTLSCDCKCHKLGAILCDECYKRHGYSKEEYERLDKP